MKKIPALLKRSLQYSFAIITFINTVAGVIGFTIRDFSEKLTWWHCLIILIAAYVVITIPIFFGLRAYQHRSYKTKINGKLVTIKVGDLFAESGWKVIPFNEFFDTQVDDVIIAHSSLNGIMIDEHIEGKIEELNTAIRGAVSACQSFYRQMLTEEKSILWDA